MTTAELLPKLQKVKRAGNSHMACCPAHEDRRQSLSVTAGDDGRILLKCHAGCDVKSITAALGITVADLFADRSREKNGSGQKRIAAIYDYRNEEAELLFQKVRYAPKGFSQRRPDGKGGFDYHLNGTRRVLYRLPELLNSREDNSDKWVFIPEGEKSVDALARMGLVATCCPGGAGKWSSDFNAHLSDLRVCILADNDDSGQSHAKQVCRSISGTARNVRLVNLPNLPPKGDVYDWLQAGGTAEELNRIADATAEYDPEADKPGPKSVRTLMRECPILRPPVIEGLLRRGETMNIIAPPKTGKSWLVTALAIAKATGRPWLNKFNTQPGNVLILDNELHGETIANRIPKVAAAMGVLVDEFADRIFVESLRGKLEDFLTLENYFASFEPGRFALVIVDAWYRALPPDVDENDNGSIAAIYNKLDQYADRGGFSFALIHHSTKGNQSAKGVTDVGAGAGSQSRATDTHLILRQHEEDNAVVLDAAVRSWAPIKPLCLKWDFPIWLPADNLDPSQLRLASGRRRQKEEQDTPAEPGIVWSPAKFVETFIGESPKTEATIMAAAEVAELSGRKAKMFLNAAVDTGLIHRWTYADRKQPHRFAAVEQPVIATGTGGEK